MIDISHSLLGPKQRGWAISFGVLTLAVTAALIPFAHRQLGFEPAVFAALYACIVTASAITAFSFGLQYRSSGAYEPGMLAVAYALVAVVTPLYAVALLNGGAFPGTHAKSSGWLFFLWHMAFLACVIGYTRKPARDGTHAVRAHGREATQKFGGIVITATAACIAAALLGALPSTLNAAGFWAPASYVAAAAIIVGSGGAIFALYRRSHGRNMLDVWLALALLVLVSNVILTMVGNSRATVGWWAARGEHVVLALTIISVFLSQTDRTVAQTLRAHSLLAEQAMIDGLTGIANRRKFDRVLADGLAHVADGPSAPVAVAIIDIDRFKIYNDEYGHLAGDETLRLVADALRTALRRELDFVARYGGEEFAMVLVDTDADEGRTVCERVRRAVEVMQIPHAGISLLQVVTVSIGLAEYRPGDDAETLLARADAALYRAKANGRNRVETETPEQLAGTP